MTTFVVIAAVMAMAAMAMIVRGARSGPPADFAARTATSLALLQQQLHELERDRERGVLSAADFDSARDDLQCRVLFESQPGIARTASGRTRWPVVVAALLLPVLAAGLYAGFGNPRAVQWPGLPALQLATDAASARTLLAQLETHVGSAPADARAWVLLARLYMNADSFDSAANAYARAIAASPRRVANDPQIWAEYADAVGMAQDGRLAGKPRELIGKALALDPAHPKALELAGSAAYEARDWSAALAFWRPLLAQLPAGSAQQAELSAAVARLARFAEPPAARGRR